MPHTSPTTKSSSIANPKEWCCLGINSLWKKDEIHCSKKFKNKDNHFPAMKTQYLSILERIFAVRSCKTASYGPGITGACLRWKTLRLSCFRIACPEKNLERWTRGTQNVSKIYIILLVFTKNLTYVIQRELDLAQSPNLNFKALAQDGVFGKCGCLINLGAGLGLKRRGDLNSQEHLLIIYLNMHLTSGWLMREQFVWDISNPDNSPEDFAR